MTESSDLSTAGVAQTEGAHELAGEPPPPPLLLLTVLTEESLSAPSDSYPRSPFKFSMSVRYFQWTCFTSFPFRMFSGGTDDVMGPSKLW